MHNRRSRARRWLFFAARTAAPWLPLATAPGHKKAPANGRGFSVNVEGATGIEPASLVWKTKALPLSYAPVWVFRLAAEQLRNSINPFASLANRAAMPSPHHTGKCSLPGRHRAPVQFPAAQLLHGDFGAAVPARQALTLVHVVGVPDGDVPVGRGGPQQAVRMTAMAHRADPQCPRACHAVRW